MKMNRAFRLFIASVFTIITCSAYAFERPFPPQAQRGVFSSGEYPTVFINGTARQLSAGGRIWNTYNLIELPAYLDAKNRVVNYTENSEGKIDRIWILTPEEINASPTQPKPNDSSIHLIQ